MKTLFKPEKLYISSDYHLRHTNVLKYDSRPFKDINKHDEAIISNHNSIIGKDDDFIFLGDFCFDRKRSTIEWLLSRLNGNKYFIKGNHDKKDIIQAYDKYGVYLGEQTMIKVGSDYKTAQNIVLNHFAMHVWDKSHHGAWLCYGHSHGSLEHTSWGKSMDVGIMLNDYKPFSYYDIKRILDKRGTKVVDHHKSK